MSKHLKLLQEAGLAGQPPAQAAGQQRLYRLEPKELAEMDRWLATFRTFWADRLRAADDHLESEQ